MIGVSNDNTIRLKFMSLFNQKINVISCNEDLNLESVGILGNYIKSLCAN